MNEQERQNKNEIMVELYGMLCNWHWRHFDRDWTLPELPHTSDISRQFANKVMDYMEKELQEQFYEGGDIPSWRSEQ